MLMAFHAFTLLSLKLRRLNVFRRKISRLLYESDILTQAGAPYYADFRNLRLGKFRSMPSRLQGPEANKVSLYA